MSLPAKSKPERVVLAAGSHEAMRALQAEMRAGRWPNLHDKHGRVGAVLTGREYPKRIVRTTGTQHYSLVGYVVWEELTT